MNLPDWFASQLREGADAFLWAVEQVPAERRDLDPARGHGEWSVRRHIFHMVYYERHIALPSMRQWLGDPIVSGEDLDEDAAWRTAPSLEDLLSAFLSVRAEQIALLPQIPLPVWEEPRPALWGTVTPRWIVTKTLQHTAEHTHDVLRMALWWDGKPSYRLP